MFGRSSNKNSSGHIGRLQRSQQIRRMALSKGALTSTGGSTVSSGGQNQDDDEEVLVVSGLCTLFCAFVIICVGAAMATGVFFILKPECMKGVSWGFTDSTLFTTPQYQQLTATTTTAAAAAEATTSDKGSNALRRMKKKSKESISEEFFPPQCTPVQLATLAHQLPPKGCVQNKNRPWRRVECSFSLATTCHDPIWFREYYAKHSVETGTTFTSIHVGCNKGYKALDMLAIGSKDSKYNWKSWRNQFLQANEKVDDKPDECSITDVDLEGPVQPARVYCIEPLPKTFQQLQSTKDKLGFGNELHLAKLALSAMPNTVSISNQDVIGTNSMGLKDWNGKCPSGNPECEDMVVDTLDHWLTSATTNYKEGDPIHYLSLGLDGYDYLALQGGTRSLDNVHYIDFEYHWLGSWHGQSLKALIDQLRTQGFVCYFAGDQNLWRITDCWQDHYEHRFYANLACVNTQIQAAHPLLQEMEKLFQKTMEKDMQFGLA